MAHGNPHPFSLDSEEPSLAGTRVFVLITRRAEIFTVRDEQGFYDLPGTTVQTGESLRRAILRLTLSLDAGEASAIGAPIDLAIPGENALCFPILTRQSVLDTRGTAGPGLTWMSKKEAEQKPEICHPALRSLRDKFPEDGGNSYVFGETARGTPTFFHLATGETLHGQVGPWEEAQHLYLPLSRLNGRQGRVVVHDLGLGCGTLALVVLDAFLKNAALGPMEIVSYDLETKGIEALLENVDKFPFAHPFHGILEKFLRDEKVTLTAPDGREATWRFVRGDFVETSRVTLPPSEKANVLFFDFFSPKSHPHLWTYGVMKNVFANAADDAILITSSSATSSRAALAASGFFVGHAPASGKRAFSTVAARRAEDLDSPLPEKWLQTFLTSHVPFCDAENEESQREIRERLMKHPQFLKGT